jgi:hypothetical protein
MVLPLSNNYRYYDLLIAMDDCAAIKRKKARFDWFSALLVSLALILEHLFHHQLHLVHTLFHALQALILAHGRVALPHSLVHHAGPHSGLSHNLQVFLHALHMFLPQALAFFSGRCILHLLHGLVHSIHVLLHLLIPFLVHHSSLAPLSGPPWAKVAKGSVP